MFSPHVKVPCLKGKAIVVMSKVAGSKPAICAFKVLFLNFDFIRFDTKEFSLKTC